MARMSTRNLDALFSPASVLIAGATDRQGSIGAQVCSNVLDSFKGRIYGVNPRRPAIAGMEMHAAIGDVPETPDLAIVVTPPDAILATAEQCAAKGVRACLIISDAKRGRERAATIRARLSDLALKSRMRIVGPNALGVLSPQLRASMAALKSPAGAIAFIGQATMATGAITEWATQQHLGFSCVAAAGDMIDVDFSDVIDWCASDARTRVIVVLMERMSEARKFISAIRQAARIKPLIVLRAPVDPLPAWREAVFEAALRRAGALCVRTLEDLFATLEAVAVRLPSDAPPALGARLAIVSNGESLGSLARAAVKGDDVTLATLSDATLDRLGAMLPPGRRRANPVDILPDAPSGRFGAALEALFEDKGVDAVLASFGPAGSTRAGEAAAAIAAVVQGARGKPGRRRPFVMTSFSGGAEEAKARDDLGKLHIPAFDTPSNAVRAFSALVALRRAAERVAATPEFVAGPDPQLLADVEHRARACLDKGFTTLDALTASAIRRSLWIGRADETPALTWRVSVETDPDFGPAIFFSPGGAFGRIAEDFAAALPPLNAATAQELIAASRHARAARAQGLLDDAETYALAALLIRLSELIATAPSIRTLSIEGVSAAGGRPVAPTEAVFGALEKYDGPADARFAIRPYPAWLEETVTLRDGASYRLRPIRAEDEPALLRMGALTSPDDLRLRFFQPIRNVSHDLAARLTQIDYDREMAFCLTPMESDALLSIVRLHRETRGESGEYAILVRSDMQGRGIGQFMMRRIVEYGRAQGLRSIFGMVLAENTGMLKLVRELGFTAHIDLHDATVVKVEKTYA